MEYQVRLDAFEGPLDLLLYLIRKAEVEITSIPITELTRQYMAYLEQLPEVDIDVAGDFLVMAATLMEIKSRTIAPPAEHDEEEPGLEVSPVMDFGVEALDPRAELVQQLLEYKQYRDAADHLEDRAGEWARRFASPGAAYDKDSVQRVLGEQAEVELDELAVFDLVEAFARITAAVDFHRLGEHRVEMESDDTPLEIHAQDIVEQLNRSEMRSDDQPALRLAEVFLGRQRVQMIGLFLAMLELTRQRRILVRQGEDHEEILIVLTDEESSHDRGEPDDGGERLSSEKG